MAYGSASMSGGFSQMPRIPQPPSTDQYGLGMPASTGYFALNPLATTPTAPTGGAAGGGSSGGSSYTPDYASLIANDPGYLALQQALSASGISNAAQRAAATQRALIQFGIVPDFQHSAASLGLSPQGLGFLSQDITPDVTALANQNTQNGLSTEARLNQAHSRAIMQLRNALAARGALSSGEANYQLNNQEQSYQQSQQDLLGKLMDAITGYQNSYLQGQQTAQTQLAQGLQDAYGRQIQLFGQGGYGGAGGGQVPAAPAPTTTQMLAPSPPPPVAFQYKVPTQTVAQAVQTAPTQAGQQQRINSLM